MKRGRCKDWKYTIVYHEVSKRIYCFSGWIRVVRFPRAILREGFQFRFSTDFSWRPERKSEWEGGSRGDAAPWINDRDNGLYGSTGLRIPRPLHKFHRAYNVKLIRQFFKSSRWSGQGWGGGEKGSKKGSAQVRLAVGDRATGIKG